jgi:arsenical pump membrane protein
MATAASLVALVVVLVLVASGRVPDVVATVPVAVLFVATGLVGLDDLHALFDRLAPTLAFLAAIFVVAETADRAGLFAIAGSILARRPRTARGLLLAVSAAAIVVTVLLSLDATAVLFTPVVIAVVRARGAESERPLLATVQLANASSSFLPVSNLTNLLVFSATGLTFGGFALRMALPTAAASMVVIGSAARGMKDRTLRAPSDEVEPEGGSRPDRDPRFAAVVAGAIGALTVGFFVGSAFGVKPAWVAVAGAALLATGAVATKRVPARVLVRATSPWFLVFVFGLAVVVQGAVDHGLGDAATHVVPTGDGLGALLTMAVVAAVFANLVNNLPATLVLVSVVPAGSVPLLLALLVGVNVGPNLTYTGSLATLLWRRVVRRDGTEPTRRAFFRLGWITTPVALVAATVALWWSQQLLG